MRQQILSTYAMTLETAQRLVADVGDERFVEMPHAGAKHPAWVLAHLAIASGMCAAVLSRDPDESPLGLSGVPEEWSATASPGKPISLERSDYGKKAELLVHLERTHALTSDRFAEVDDAFLSTEFPIAEYRSFFPTRLDCVVYMMAHHEGYHLGQLTMWRMAAGLGSVAPF
ncbi:MAG: DinB family protein [Phycisphaerales bacterium]